MKARERGATIIHVDPRFSRTSALADIWVPIRAGSDIAFLGGLTRHVIENNLFFREYVVHCTNASCILREEFRLIGNIIGGSSIVAAIAHAGYIGSGEGEGQGA